jgi:hypothetical protein
MKNKPGAVLDDGRQAGSGILSIVAGLGLILLLVQGTNFYRARESARFLNTEKNKVLAMQMAEAGVEENIADLGKGTRVVTAGMVDVVTYDHKVLDGGNYTSRISTVAIGAGTLPDIVDLVSSGVMGAVRQTIQARLQLNKTTTTIPAVVPPAPATVPRINTTPGYAPCMALVAPNTCTVCHVPPAVGVSGIYTQSGGSMVIFSHGNHVGDYLVPNGTPACTLYLGTPAINTTEVKVQILTWK